jgi:hypothetical protein
MLRAPAAVLIALAVLSSGCMIIGRNDEFEFDKSASHVTGEYAPDFYVDKHKQNVVLPFLWIYAERPPHDVVMLNFDQTYEAASEGYTEVVIDSLTIEREGESPVELVSSALPLAERTYAIAKDSGKVKDKATVVFKAAIPDRRGFTLSLRGYAVDARGKHFPFERRETYRFEGQRWIVGPMAA